MEVFPVPSSDLTSNHPQTLDLCTNGILYDKYISICQRSFKVPIILISLADNNQLWFQSTIEYGVDDCPCIKSLCSYVISCQYSEVMIIEDILNDERLLNITLNIKMDRPQLRFFAGAPLIVKEVTVGSLCIFDIESRNDFTEDDKMRLLDFSSAVSLLVSTQRDSVIFLEEKLIELQCEAQNRHAYNLRVEKRRQMADLMHQVRTPLMNIKLNASLVESGQKEFSKYLKPDPECLELSHRLNTSISDLQSSIFQLDQFVITSLHLDDVDNEGKISIPNCSSPNPRIERLNSDDTAATVRPLQCNIDEMLELVKLDLPFSGDSIEVEWVVEEDLATLALTSHPEAFTSTILSVLNQAVGTWRKASVSINFTLYKGHSFNQIPVSSKNTLSITSLDHAYSGYMTIMMRISNPILVTSQDTHPSASARVAPPPSIDIQPLERLLYSIGGDCRLMAFDADSSANMCFTKPPAANATTTTTSSKASTVFLNELLVEVHIPADIHNIINKESEDDDDDDEEKSDYSDDDSDDDDCPYGVRSKYADTTTAAAATTCDNNSIKLEEYHNTIELTTTATTTAIATQAKLRVLIVDDSAIIYKVMSRWLCAQSCEVTVAENGLIGLNYLKTQCFDITLMDFIMPVMLGRDAMRQFQEWKEEAPGTNTINDSMILIGMSANASKRDQEEAYDYGIHYFAAKPVDLVFLTAVLEAKRSGGNGNARGRCGAVSLSEVFEEIQLRTGVAVVPRSTQNRHSWRKISRSSLNNIQSSNADNNDNNYDIQRFSKRKRGLDFINKKGKATSVASVEAVEVSIQSTLLPATSSSSSSSWFERLRLSFYSLLFGEGCTKRKKPKSRILPEMSSPTSYFTAVTNTATLYQSRK